MAKEIELKLRATEKDLQALAVWLDQQASQGIRASGSKALLNDYYDTPEFGLAKPRAALRIRSTGDAFEQTFKTQRKADSAVQVRNEWNWPRSERALDTSLLISGEAAEYWPESVSVDELGVVFSTDFERRRWLCTEGNSTIEVVIDSGAVKAGEQEEPLCETELELQSGDPADMWALLAKMQAQVPLWLSDVSKAERGYRLAGGETKPAYRASETPLDDVFNLQRAVEAFLFAGESGTAVRRYGQPLAKLLPADDRAVALSLFNSFTEHAPASLVANSTQAAALTQVCLAVADVIKAVPHADVNAFNERWLQARSRQADMVE